MKLITINGNGNGDYDVSAHRADCADVPKAKRGHDWFEDDVESKRALWLDYNSDFLAEGGAWPIHFFPCTKGLPDGGSFNTQRDEPRDAYAIKAGDRFIVDGGMTYTATADATGEFRPRIHTTDGEIMLAHGQTVTLIETGANIEG